MTQNRKTRKGGLPPIHHALLHGHKLASVAIKSKLATSKGLKAALKKGVLLSDDLLLASHKVIKPNRSTRKNRSRKSKIIKSLEAIPMIINPTEG
jgi:hypothetical protein